MGQIDYKIMRINEAGATSVFYSRDDIQPAWEEFRQLIADLDPSASNGNMDSTTAYLLFKNEKIVAMGMAKRK